MKVRFRPGFVGVALLFLLSACEGRVIVDKLPPLEEAARPDVISIHVRADGVIMWSNAEVTREELVRRLALEAVRVPQPEVHIGADPKTKYEDLAPVIKEAEHSGLAKIGIVGGT
jgi:biopolymer transport protein ExbD